MLKILFIGDIVSRLGRQAVKEFVPKIKSEHDIDLVIANIENATNGRGVCIDHYEELLSYGINAFSAGEHIYRVAEIKDQIDNMQIAVPTNFYNNHPGKRYLELDLGAKGQVYLVSLLGTALMADPLHKNPFRAIDVLLEELNTKNVIVDFHAEATSEKQALKHYLDGRVLAVVGTHTHVQTADEQITQKNTAYITDLGMTGSTNSVIGVKTDIIVNRLSKGEKSAFVWEKEGPYSLNAVIISIDMQNQIAKNIQRISFKGS
jgi:hypothetical protein